MKKIITTIFLSSVLSVPAMAQWSTNFNYGCLDNACPNWSENGFNNKPFSIWANGWQAGSGLEYRMKGWLALGSSFWYQSFNARPSGRYVAGIDNYNWNGESSWNVPAELYLRIIKSKAIMGSNIKLSVGMMASHIGRLELNKVEGTTQISEIVASTGETVYRPYGQVSLGIKAPLTARFGITADYGYLSTFDRMIAELPFKLGVEIGLW
jgi:hypothetical protein